eukprot:m.291297 g.291297  ORF g.291297 m.291297 type:complete len:324 (-) comp12452_c0_seq1:942-1913(-)
MAAARRTNSDAAVQRVAIIGGTHGNETNGVYLARYFQSSPEVIKRSSFECSVVFSNTAAIENNTRYVETDLNRCFDKADLADESLTLLEQRRAKELDRLLGPKASADPATDFVIDLHNTTANTGVALMMAPTDDFAHEVGAYLQSIDPTVRIVEWNASKDDWPLLPTIGRSGFTFEVGPCPWGCVIGESYDQSRRLVLATLDYIEAHNAAVAAGVPRTTPLETAAYQAVHTIDYPRDPATGQISAVIHPELQNKDFVELAEGAPAFLRLDGSTVPFHRADYGVGADEQVFPFFINEAAYYEKGIAFMLARIEKRTINIIQPRK